MILFILKLQKTRRKDKNFEKSYLFDIGIVEKDATLSKQRQTCKNVLNFEREPTTDHRSKGNECVTDRQTGRPLTYNK